MHAGDGRAQRLGERRRSPALGEERAGHGEMDEQGRRVKRGDVQRAARLGELPRRARGLRGGDAPGGDGALDRGGSASRAAAKAAWLCTPSKAPWVSAVSAVMRISSLGRRCGAGGAGKSCYMYSTDVL